MGQNDYQRTTIYEIEKMLKGEDIIKVIGTQRICWYRRVWKGRKDNVKEYHQGREPNRSR